MHIQHKMPQLCDAQKKRLYKHVRTLSLCGFFSQSQEGVEIEFGLSGAGALLLQTSARGVNGNSEKMLDVY